MLEGVEGLDAADDAFSAFVAARQRELVQLGWALTGDRQLGEDLVQTALLRLWPHWSRVAAAGEPFAYTQRIVINLWSSWRRRRRWQAERLDASPPDSSGGDVAVEAQTRTSLDAWLARLPRRQRAVLVLRFVCDLDVAETADQLGCAPGTVKSQTSKALRTLRANVESVGSFAEEASS